jgi:hypothetical protein
MKDGLPESQSGRKPSEFTRSTYKCALALPRQKDAIVRDDGSICLIEERRDLLDLDRQLSYECAGERLVRIPHEAALAKCGVESGDGAAKLGSQGSPVGGLLGALQGESDHKIRDRGEPIAHIADLTDTVTNSISDHGNPGLDEFEGIGPDPTASLMT